MIKLNDLNQIQILN